MAEVQVRSRRIHAQLHAQRFARRTRSLKFRAKFILADDFRRTFLYVCELVINRGESWH
jgi:hypothetical protein